MADEIDIWVAATSLRLDSELAALGAVAAEHGEMVLVLDGPPAHARLHHGALFHRHKATVAVTQRMLPILCRAVEARGWEPEDRGGAGPAFKLLDRISLDLLSDLPFPSLPRSNRDRLLAALRANADVSAGVGVPAPDDLLIYLTGRLRDHDLPAKDLLDDFHECRHQLRDADSTLKLAMDLDLPPDWREALTAADGPELRVPTVDRVAHRSPEADDTEIAEFCGLRLRVTSEVWRPRSISEKLVKVAIEAVEGCSSPTLIDTGTGSGAVALAVASRRADARIWAIDVKAEAIACAEANRKAIGVKNVTCVVGGLLQPVPASARGQVDVITGNLPYVPAVLARDAEGTLAPTAAVTGPDADGLGLVRALIEDAHSVLKPGGLLAVQVAELQRERVTRAFTEHGYAASVVSRAESESAIVVCGRWRSNQ